ncbi:hypothetical protein IAD21_01232 [Abditibacteriota bacterium]|nr:hypothetical protein IAD21_01232 [Abditibacteriota bacterium]
MSRMSSVSVKAGVCAFIGSYALTSNTSALDTHPSHGPVNLRNKVPLDDSVVAAWHARYTVREVYQRWEDSNELVRVSVDETEENQTMGQFPQHTVSLGREDELDYLDMEPITWSELPAKHSFHVKLQVTAIERGVIDPVEVDDSFLEYLDI